MPIAFSQEMPITKEMYKKTSEAVGKDAPPGLIVHLAFETDRGMRFIDVWESEAQLDQFREQRLRPIVDKVMAESGRSREDMGPPQEEDLRLVEIYGPSLGKRLF